MATFSSGSAGADITRPSAAPDQGISEDNVITLGLTGPTSGPLASAGSIKTGAQAYFDMINEAGGVNGYTIELSTRDDNATPSQTVTAVRDLWENDKVFAIFAPYGSSPVNAASQYINENDIPTIFPYATSTIFFPNDNPAPSNAFGVVAPYDGQVLLAAQYAAEELGVESVALVHTQDDFGNSAVAPMEQAVDDYGLEIADDIGYDSTETNFSPLGQRIASSDADAVLVWAIPGATQIMTAARTAGFEGPFIIGDAFRGGALQELLLAVPGIYGNVYMVNSNVLYDDDDVAEYREVVGAEYPDADTTQALTGWAWAALLVHAIDLATEDGTPLSWETLSGAFESIDEYNEQGLRSISFSPDDHLGLRAAQIHVLNEGPTWEVVQDFTPLPEMG
jgi:ABC-type branched-subunit amino acid transport system substrate-binding protein